MWRRLATRHGLAFATGAAFGGVLSALYLPLREIGASPNPTLDLVDLLIDVSPGPLATWAIETFGHGGKALLTGAGAVAWMILAGLIAALARVLAGADSSVRKRTLFAAVGLLLAIVAIELLSPGAGVGFDSIFALSATAAGWALASQALAAAPEDLEEPPPWRVRGGRPLRSLRTRRRALGAVAIAAAGGAGGSLLIWNGIRVAARGGVPVESAESRDVAPPGFDPNFTPAPGTRPLVTRNQDFYRVDITTTTPQIDASRWALKVGGAVSGELALDFSQILALPSVSIYGTLQCISNEVGGDLISTSLWTGVPLALVLRMAGPSPAAADVAFLAEGGYSDSIPLAKAMEPDVLLAYAMNGEALPPEHGFPLRAYIPNIYGMKNVKWINEIRVVERDHKGYWQERGWSDDATVKIASAIDLPKGRARFRRGAAEIGGIAYAGSRGIGAVEIAVDDAESWAPARLERALSRLTWRRWKATLKLEPGRHDLRVRAVDAQGALQIAVAASPHPSGASGYHEVTIVVEA